MKKNLLLLFAFVYFSIIGGQAQTMVLCENFSDYDTTTVSASFHGWTLSYFTKQSLYTSTASSGPSGPNSYKFGVDSATAITPSIIGADHINFWYKGNPGPSGMW